jgi:hypothetical protein
MRIIGCDLHARQQTLAMLETTTGEVANLTLMHEGDEVREFYSQLPRPVLVGMEATGSMQWFLSLMEELESNAGLAIPPRFALRNPANRNMTDATRTRRSVVQIHSPRPLPKPCLSLVYATFCFLSSSAFCGQLWTNSKPKPRRRPFLPERHILFEL